MLRVVAWARALGQWVVALWALLLGWAWLEVFILKPAPPSRWATAPDLPQVAPVGERVVLVLIDGMNADRAFDAGSMPFLASMRAQGAWGVAAAQVPTLTGSAVTTLGTGRWTTLLDAIYNFQAPPSPSDSVFRRLDDAGRRAALIGDSAWASRFGLWADVLSAAPDHGVADTHRSDDESAAAFEAWLGSDMRHPLVVMHWVGADHAGHGAGSTADGSPYAARLAELDAQLARLWAALYARDPRASMLVISDHGMTAKGGHGGAEAETRRAPFVWWGLGIARGGPLDLTQAQIAPSVAAYLGVPPPAEAAQPAYAPLFVGLSGEAAADLTRSWERQRRAVQTGPDGQPMPAARAARPFAVAALALLAAAAAVAVWRARAVLGASLGAAAPVLRWWGDHLWLYGALLGVALIAVVGWRRGGLWALAVAALTASLGGPWAPSAWGERGWLGVASLVGIGVWALVAPAEGRAPRAPRLAALGVACLCALAVAQRLWPTPLTSAALLVAGAVSVGVLGRASEARAAVGAALLLAGALYGDGPLCALWLLTAAGWALARAARQRPMTSAGALCAPALVVAWEVLAYFALGKDYSLSAVQVALAFTLDVELSLGSALGMVAAGEVVPWAVGALLLASRYWPSAAAVMGAALVGRLALLMAAFGWVERSFWVTSSVVPALISAWIIAMAWPWAVWAWRPRADGAEHPASG